VIFSDYVDHPDNLLIEGCQVRRRNPILLMSRVPDLFDRILGQELAVDLKFKKDVASQPDCASLVFHSLAICVAYCRFKTG
jgi:hypothetical protein